MSTSAIFENTVLSAVGTRTILNLLCKILFRLLHFVLNGIIFRNIDPNIIGIANVRLQLLYTTILFLTREAFRRTVPKINDLRSIHHYVNLTWLTIPIALSIICLCLPVTCFLKTDLAENYPYYYHACVFYAFAAVIELLSEPFYLLASLTRNYHINIYTEMIGSTIGFTIQAILIYRNTQSALYFYGLGYMIYSSLITFIYYVYFLTRSKEERSRLFLIRTFSDLVIKPTSPFVDYKLFNETLTFLKQGLWMKILTEGERYFMSLFTLVSYKDQGIFDVVNNLGSLLPRLVFSTLEESAYIYFQQTLPRTRSISKSESDQLNSSKQQIKETEKISSDEKTIILNAFEFFNYSLRFVMILSLLVITFGIPYSRFLLNLYGGSNLSDGIGPQLLSFYFVYLLFLAINGITEAFSQATMSIEQLANYRTFISISAVIYLCFLYFLINSIGICGIIIANCLNMLARIGVNSFYIYRYFPNYPWSKLSRFSYTYPLALISCSLLCIFSEEWLYNTLIHFGFGVMLGLLMLIFTWHEQREMIHYIYCIFRLNRKKKSS